MARISTPSARKVVGLGFLPDEARHGFLIDVPKGAANGELVSITEHRGKDLDHLGARAIDAPSPNDPALRVLIDRGRWLALAPAFWDEANRRLRANGLPLAKFQKTWTSRFQCIRLLARSYAFFVGRLKKLRLMTFPMRCATGRRLHQRSAGGCLR